MALIWATTRFGSSAENPSRRCGTAPISSPRARQHLGDGGVDARTADPRHGPLGRLPHEVVGEHDATVVDPQQARVGGDLERVEHVAPG